MGTNEIRLRGPAGADCRISQSIGQREIGEPHGAPGGSDKQVRIRFEIGVQTQGGAAHHNAHVVTIIGFGEFGGNQPPQPAQPGGRRALAAHLAVERMGHPHLHPRVDGFQRDQPTHVGLLDRRRVGDPRQRRQPDRLADSQHIHDVADRGRQGPDPRFDQFGQAGRHNRIAEPPPDSVLPHQPPVGDLLLHNVAQIQHIAAGQLPQPDRGIRIQGSAQSRRQQRVGFAA